MGDGERGVNEREVDLVGMGDGVLFDFVAVGDFEVVVSRHGWV